jgi:hypothetical protein
MKFYYIYQITNLTNNKIYIGKHIASSLENDYMGSGKLLKKAIKKHGLKNFKKDILFVFDNEQDMNIKEKKLVTEEFCLRKDTYNLCVGGKGGFSFINRYNLHCTEKQKEAGKNNIKKAQKKYKELWHFSDEFRKHCKEKNSEAQKKLRKKIGGAFKGKKHTEEAKQKISQSSKKRKQVIINGLIYNSFTEARKATGLNFNKLNKLFK